MKINHILLSTSFIETTHGGRYAPAVASFADGTFRLICYTLLLSGPHMKLLKTVYSDRTEDVMLIMQDRMVLGKETTEDKVVYYYSGATTTTTSGSLDIMRVEVNYDHDQGHRGIAMRDLKNIPVRFSLLHDEEKLAEYREHGETCALCLDVLFEPKEMQPCKHVFCHECITQHFMRSSNFLCPLCMSEIVRIGQRTLSPDYTPCREISGITNWRISEGSVLNLLAHLMNA